MERTIAEQLTGSTVRIVCELADKSSSTGTGFFFKLLDFDEGAHLPVIVTNKHVVKDSVSGTIVFNTADEDGNILFGKQFVLDFVDFEKLWIPHPDPEIDLCIFPAGGMVEQAKANGRQLSYVQFDKSILPSEEDLAEITAAEDIIMIGYPNAIWDEINNMPIVRKGITATHPYLNYNGRDEFVIDAACFPGSSGSPVLLYNINGYSQRDGSYVIGKRIKLLGILYAGPIHTATGEVKVVTIPTTQKAIAFSQIPNNLGFVIKAKKILDFAPILEELIANTAT